MSKTHTVDWTTMANYQADLWNITVTNPYTVVLNDTLTVSSGTQALDVNGYPNTSAFASGIPPVWTVVFVSNIFASNTTFNFFVYDTNGSIVNAGYSLPCNSGTVQVVMTATQITFIGTSPVTSNLPFENLGQIATLNDGGDFNGGQLDITLTS
jgi:hypothetical protein